MPERLGSSTLIVKPEYSQQGGLWYWAVYDESGEAIAESGSDTEFATREEAEADMLRASMPWYIDTRE